MVDINPEKLARWSMTAMIGGGLTSAAGAYLSTAGQQTATELDGDFAFLNARQSRLQAMLALQSGRKAEQTVRMQTAALKADQKTALAANGVDITVGSAAETLQSTDLIGDMDADAVRQQARWQASGYRTQAAMQEASGKVSKATARTMNPFAAAGADLLGSAGAVAGSWYNYKKRGML